MFDHLKHVVLVFSTVKKDSFIFKALCLVDIDLVWLTLSADVSLYLLIAGVKYFLKFKVHFMLKSRLSPFSTMRKLSMKEMKI